MRCALFAACAILLLGCGGDLATVEGQVKLDGRPLVGSEKLRGTVQFFPESGRGAAATGYLDHEARYNMSSGSQHGISPGAYRVAVSASEIIPPQTPGEAPGGRPATPRKFADPRESGFTANVKPGHNTFDFELTTANNN